MAGARPKTCNENLFSGRLNASPLKSHQVTASNDRDRDLLHHVFYSETQKLDPLTKKGVSFENVDSVIDKAVDLAVAKNADFIATYAKRDDIGRLGNACVGLDTTGNAGTMVIEADRLGVTSHSNFSTIRATSCVYKGKWVYELMLGTKGVMQLGWCTLGCKFTQEDGVGDTEDSYAYDGNRVRKWNRKTPMSYGEMWLTGDVITCALDCDNGTATFYRQGKDLGPAFENVQLGEGFAYFPAVSLSLAENVRLNFGSTPILYPVEGYRPMQDPPAVDLVSAQVLFNYLEKLVPYLDEENPGIARLETLTEDRRVRSHKATVLLVASHIFQKLGPLLRDSYIVEAHLLKFLLKNNDAGRDTKEQPLLAAVLDLLWALLQEHELKPCLEYLLSSVLSRYRFAVVTPDFTHQKSQLRILNSEIGSLNTYLMIQNHFISITYLVLTLAIMRHQPTRKHALKHLIFDHVKFHMFMHIKLPDDSGLSAIVHDVWWGFKTKIEEETDGEEKEEEALSSDEMRKRDKYYACCRRLQEKVTCLENLQVQILKLLLINTDSPQGASSRFVFLYKFRELLKDNAVFHTRTSVIVNQCSLPVALCFFHRLVKAIREYWDQFHHSHPITSNPSSEAFVPCCKFYDETIHYWDIQRLGGLHSHLRKTCKEELEKSQREEFNLSSKALPYYLDCIRNNDAYTDKQRRMYEDHGQGRDMASCASLVELLDGAIMLYTILAHKQLTKMCTLRDIVHDFISALKDSEEKIRQCPPELPEVATELKRSRDVFLEKTSQLSRDMAWVLAVIFSKEKQGDVYWLLRSVLRTLTEASSSGRLFTFTPDFYVEGLVYIYSSLRTCFYPSLSYKDLPGFTEVLKGYAEFLCTHFSDDRVVNGDAKDTLVQALQCFVCYPVSLRALESLPLASKLKMVRAVLAPYDNRSWAQTNWIVVRLWKGCGFGFRYKRLPHPLPSRNMQQEIDLASVQKPCPSVVFQGHMRTVLLEDEEVATKLIDTLLSQLNWAFSEFIGMLQELQVIAARPNVALIDARQLKICATCFDLAVGLLRVLEMIAGLTPEYLTDWSKPSAELLLCRLFQLLTQVLNRVTSKSSVFDAVVTASMPGLESVEHFPILAAVTGVLVQLLCKADKKSRECATAAFLAEPGFQLSCLEFLLGGSTVVEASATPPTGAKNFSFKNCNVNQEEIEMVENLIGHLRNIQKEAFAAEPTDIDEESLCSICYARPQTAMFFPCEHRSCKACISHHLLNKKECFFCKTIVERVVDLQEGTPV